MRLRKRNGNGNGDRWGWDEVSTPTRPGSELESGDYRT